MRLEMIDEGTNLPRDELVGTQFDELGNRWPVIHCVSVPQRRADGRAPRSTGHGRRLLRPWRLPRRPGRRRCGDARGCRGGWRRTPGGRGGRRSAPQPGPRSSSRAPGLARDPRHARRRRAHRRRRSRRSGRRSAARTLRGAGSHDHVMARGTSGREDPGRISQRRQLDRPGFVVLTDGCRRRRRDEQDRLGEQLAHVDAGGGGRDEVVRVDHHDVAGAGLESAQSFCRLVLLHVDHEPGMAITQGLEDPGEKRSCEGREHAEPDGARHHRGWDASSASARARARRAASTWGRTERPAGLRRMPRPCFSTNATPVSRSRARSCWDTADGV